MLSSKDLIDRGNISRATLNNYIKLGLLPKPQVMQPEGIASKARRIGYFPDAALSAIQEIDRRKRGGDRMDQIVRDLAGHVSASENPKQPAALPASMVPPTPTARKAPAIDAAPRFSAMTALVAGLQDGDRIRAELPGPEYFELIVQIGTEADRLFDKFGAARGATGDDRWIGYFLPHAGGHYLLDAVLCGQELLARMAAIDDGWRQRKGWLNSLRLNIGLDAGEEWVGADAGADRHAAVPGAVPRRATAMSNVAADGTMWATKQVTDKLLGERDKLVQFGIYCSDTEGGEIFVPASYARLQDIIEPDDPRYISFADSGDLPVTQILEVQAPPSV